MNISLYYAFDNLVSASKDFMLVLVDYLTSEGISTYQQGGTDGKYNDNNSFDPAAAPAPAPAPSDQNYNNLSQKIKKNTVWLAYSNFK